MEPIHGDTMATTNADGTVIATYQYDPFGNKISTSLPTNTAQNASFGWLGQNEKTTETNMVLAPTQMGARIYIPSLGRFLQPDPVEGGTANNYVYPPDPLNDFDLDGNWGLKDFANIASIGSIIPGPIGMACSAASAVAYAAAGDKKNAAIMAAGIALSAVGAGAAVAAYKAVKTVNVAAKAVRATNKSKFVIGKHAKDQMAARGVTSAMVKKTIQKGAKYNDRMNPGTVAHVLKGGMASGRTLHVVQNPSKNKIITVIVRSKFKPGKRWY